MKIRRLLVLIVLTFIVGIYQGCTNGGSGAFVLNGSTTSSAVQGSSTVLPGSSPGTSPTPTPTPTPTPGPSPAAITAIATNYVATCAIVNKAGVSSVQCWGGNQNGELGNGTTTPSTSLTPITVTGASSGATQIDTHRDAFCATVNGNALCWGNSYGGLLGNGVSTGSGPVNPTGLPSGVVKVAVGYESACALVQPGGTVYCWGAENFGELGNGTQFSSDILPFAVASGASDIAMNDETACVIISGNVYCWGSNWYGAAGQPNYTPSGSNYMTAHPTIVSGSSGAIALTSGSILTDSICELLNDNRTVKCWGGDANGGSDTNTPTTLFVASSTIYKIFGVQDGDGSGGACAALASGSLVCQSFGGSLAAISGLTGVIDYSDNSGGGYASPTSGCSVSSNGTADCWGSNNDGQLGIGSLSPTYSTTPLPVTVVH